MPATAEDREQRAYQELQAYTLAHGGAEFIHQYVVDAWMAQHADQHTKPIGLTFALIGLHLHLERRFSGREVQRVHVLLGRRRRSWPSFVLPADRGSITALQVMSAAAGAERDRAIDAWCASAWEAHRPNHATVAELLRQCGIG